MTVSLTTKPDYPVADREVRISATITTGNFWRLFVTDAPPGSELRRRLDADDANRIEVFAGDDSAEWRHTFDLPGAYLFDALDITRANTAGGGYQDAAENDQTETVNATSSVTLYVGAFVDLELGAGTSEPATLRLFVVDDTIRETSIQVHGEKTPRVIADTIRARTAAATAAVVDNVGSLPDDLVSDALGDLATVADDIRTKYEAHRASTTFHYSSADVTNTVPFASDASGHAGVIAVPDALVRAIAGHVATDDASGNGPASGDWHQDGSGGVTFDPDRPQIIGAAALNVAINALAESHRVYEAHRAKTTNVHKVADITNTLAPLPKLLAIASGYLGGLASASPTAAATDNAATALLVHVAGARPA